MSLEPGELENLKSRIGRMPTRTEMHIVAAEWSEHCSYKSSKMHLKKLPMKGPLVISEKGYDSGVLDAGNGYVITAHIESHNHPSAVEPYGGAATGVGGVIRDILSAGTRPIAILDGLRFGDISTDMHSRWLFKSAVSGIADYGNCLGIPTVGGEVEFDECYQNYALVDVAAVGFGKRADLVRNHAQKGDLVVLLGGMTGRDGIGGSQFASDSLESENRSAVQIPDPFIEKLIIEAVIEARRQNLIHAMKDLGGGGLSCAISETADALEIGMDVDVKMVHTREQDMNPEEIMTSESQERMLIITGQPELELLQNICKKFRISCSVIGHVTADRQMRIRRGQEILADIPAGVVANASLLDLPSKRPQYLDEMDKRVPEQINNYTEILERLLTSPNIASRAWVYNQYDHEVGIRTVVRPGLDASVLRLDNGRYLALTIDANPKHCHVNPRQGAAGCFEEACRNIVCVGARPAGMLDHLQFGSPENPEIFWTFLESLEGLAEYAKILEIPCIGGKVSLYNETPAGPIKPTPMIAILGLADKLFVAQKTSEGDSLIVLGDTKNEMGGSEYYEYIHKITGGTCPAVDSATSKKNMNAVLDIIDGGLVKSVHDCSKGGLAVAISELCMTSGIGCSTNLDDTPGDAPLDAMLFSESHSRYLLVVEPKNKDAIISLLKERRVFFGDAGRFGGKKMRIECKGSMIDLSVDKAQKGWSSSLGRLVHG
ncbi:MAG: phosphoribosylformylglycinamidine synthase subunit PurL [Nitrosopumilus sp. B06]|nr:MAG: phosphoribosylformylglycinamidine synthase subunit PurL [Nitrosopumilus sp. D6]RNJ78695.1 MAG: phosphoribosylformylglycinamidine synthase subunit PurL [Nitrosopumilus sp. B06]